MPDWLIAVWWKCGRDGVGKCGRDGVGRFPFEAPATGGRSLPDPVAGFLLSQRRPVLGPWMVFVDC